MGMNCVIIYTLIKYDINFNQTFLSPQYHLKIKLIKLKIRLTPMFALLWPLTKLILCILL